MRALLILGLCATAMVANARTAKTDTVNRYIINGQTINNFNGTQLQGKTVKSYNVATQNEKNRVVVTHTITIDGAGTSADKKTPTFVEPLGKKAKKAANNPKLQLVIVDGVERPQGVMGPRADEIESYITYGPDSKEAKAYGEKGKNGVTFITTKQKPMQSSSQNQKPSPMFKFEVKGNDGVSYVTEADMLKIVDGVVVDELPGPGNYISAKAWGPGSPEAKEFGEIGKNGVVIVRTKQIPTKINSVYSDQLNMAIIGKDDSSKLPFKVVYSKGVTCASEFAGNCIRLEFWPDDEDKSFDVVVIPGVFDDYVLYVDGEKSATMPAANNISRIEAFAPGTEKAKAYASGGKGAVLIDTRTNIFIVDGKRVSAAEMKALDTRKIKSIDVLKGESAKRYTEDPRVGVFVVKTK